MNTSKKKALIIIAVFVVVIALAATAYSALSQQNASPQMAPSSTSSTAGSQSGTAAKSSSSKTVTAPSSTVYAADGTQTTLKNIADGKPMVVNFWATWCPYCLDEMDDLQKLYEEYGGKVQFAIVNVADKNGEAESGAAYISEHGYTFPVYYDTDHNGLADYQVSGLPTTAIIGADGSMISYTPGRLTMSKMASALDAL
ncbi:TlpA family protein disulfide reductase [Curtanaerobium respiraculi]|uniref:TlpA family protein disulfide reductase n=1 Tax=Curtanaerobium respiraculi TaxID=2949669 RepID=UPI0024B3A978|nr:TlpA disulfide reductase family protein [Curtanaerobium respiraculi]